MNTIQSFRRLLPVLALLAACGSPTLCGACGDAGGDGPGPDGGELVELPAAFRVDAEIVSVVPGAGRPASAVDQCSPAPADIDPGGPDWPLRFDRIHDPDEPTFQVDEDGPVRDSAWACEDAGGTDCCRPLRVERDGWVLECEGRDIAPFRRVFAFTFFADGSGTAASTLGIDGAEPMCIATVEWPGIAPL